MKKARIIIGANYGDEGKGTVVARYTKETSGRVLNILTNGGAQRGHSVITEYGETTFQHFGSGTYGGADNYYSCFYIINPLQFVKEYDSLLIKPSKIYRDPSCRWSTPYDMIANHINEESLGRHASCCMGIWFTVRRYRENGGYGFDEFIKLSQEEKEKYLLQIKKYYEKKITIPQSWKDIWEGPYLTRHFIQDCERMWNLTEVKVFQDLSFYDNFIFEGGQGLLLSDTGEDREDRTPSETGIRYSLEILRGFSDIDITAHYVTRPYLTRHGDGLIDGGEIGRKIISDGVQEDRTNHYNPGQGEFRYGILDIEKLKSRILHDSSGHKFEINLTHCDEMDRLSEFTKIFNGNKINTSDSPII